MLNQYCFTKARPVLIIPIMYQHWFDIANRILINKVDLTLARIVNDGHSFMGTWHYKLKYIAYLTLFRSEENCGNAPRIRRTNNR